MIATRDSAGTESMAPSFRGPPEAVLRHRGHIDFVAPRDSILPRIVRGRGALYSNLTIAGFEAAAASRLELVKSLEIDGLYRCLYLFRRRHART